MCILKHLRHIAAVIVSLTGTAVAWAQSTEVSGVVRDSSHAHVAGAAVILLNEKTGERLALRTNGAGLYVLSGMTPGTYTLTVSSAGFGTQTVKGLVVDTGAKMTQNFDLSVGAASDTVEVSGEAATMNLTDATVSTVIDRRFVENLPLNGRSFQSLITLAPGVTVVPSQGSGASGEISVNGQRTEANYFTIDGISADTGATVTSAGTPGAGFSGSTPQATALGTTQAIVSIDALEEFRATTSSYSAEYGRTPGGQFSFSTRSGTNQWHGSAFDYLRNTALDALNYFDTAKLPERQNDFGGTFGGPVRLPRLYDGRDKTFFFFSYEGVRLTSPQAALLTEVPSAALRSAAPTALRPFLNAFPVANQNGGADLGNGLAYFKQGYSAPSGIDTTSLRVDHSFSDRVKIFGRVSYVPSSSELRSTSALSQVNQTVSNLKTAVFGSNVVLNSAMVNEFRIGLTGNGYNSNRFLDNFGGAAPVPLSTAPGLADGDWMTFFLFYGLYPYYLLEPQSNRQRQFNVVDSMTQVAGRHSLKYGIDFRRLVTSEKLPPLWEVGFYGSEGAILANQPLGLYVYTQDINMKSVQKQFGAYLEDEWKVTDHLSLSAGLRWDVNPAPADANGNTPYTVTQINNLATTQAAPKDTALWKTTWSNVAPRIGVAYQLQQRPGRETTLRAGGGLFYDTGQVLSAEGYYGIGTTGFASYTSAFPATLQQVQATPVPSASAPYNAPIFAYDPGLKLPYTGQWNIAVEQAMGTAQTLTLNYVASAARRLTVQRFYDPSALGNSLFSQGKGLYITTNAASADYNALQVKFDRKLARGFQFLGAYTWAHGFDTATTNFTVYSLERGPSDYDIRNNFQAALSYDIGGHYANGLASYVLRHWSVDARESSRSALPVDVLRASTLDATTGTGLLYHPNYDRSQPLYVYGSQYPGGRAINYCAFDGLCTPGATTHAGEGNSGRNIARGFDAVQTDLTLRRDFPFTERTGVQFRAEAYNVLNHPVYGNLYSSLSTGRSLFGQAYNTESSSLGGLSSLYQVGGPRSLQVSLKLHF